MPTRMTIAGVPVDAVRFEEAIGLASKFLDDGTSHFVVTPNPEMAVKAAGDPEFRRILESSDLALADGYGLKLAGYATGKHVPETITGVDFSLALAGLCEQKNCSIYLLGGGKGIAERASERLRQYYPDLEIAGADDGGKIRYRHGEWDQSASVLKDISRAKPDILLVALGHGKQERWIRDHLNEFPSVKIAVGIGGALDYISGKVKRAPGAMRVLHLEWLWRLARQPWRFPRILIAVIIFPLLAVWLLLRRK